MICFKQIKKKRKIIKKIRMHKAQKIKIENEEKQ